LVGSYLTAVKGYQELIDIIGAHLVKSEVYCVGHMYALVLAFFNDSKSIDYLNKYLTYYLTRPDLYFAQDSVLGAIMYLDKINSSNHLAKHLQAWHVFTEAQESSSIKKELSILDSIKDPQEKIAKQELFKKKIRPQKTSISTSYFDTQIPVLRELNQY
jgi:hypothetical protein